MKTLTKTRPCYYCKITIDIENEDFVRINTLQSVMTNSDKAYAHELCVAQADREADEEQAMEDYLDEYAGPVQYEERFDGEY